MESEPGLPHNAKDQPSKDKPKVKTKGRPRAGDREPKPAAPRPNEKKRHRGGPSASTKALSGPEPTKDNVEDRSPEHLALVPLTHSQGPKHDNSSGGRTSGCRRAVVVQEDPGKDKLQVPLRDTKLLSPLRDTPPLQSLVVKITLDLLSWVPQPPGKGSRQKKPEDKPPPAGKKLDSEKRSSDNSSKLAKKRKVSAVVWPSPAGWPVPAVLHLGLSLAHDSGPELSRRGRKCLFRLDSGFAPKPVTPSL